MPAACFCHGRATFPASPRSPIERAAIALARPAIRIERRPTDPVVEIVVKAHERVSRHSRERLELDRREGQAASQVTAPGFSKNRSREILIREKLAQRPLHRLLSHRRPPRYGSLPQPSKGKLHAIVLTTQESPDFQALRVPRRPGALLIASCSGCLILRKPLGTRQRAGRKQPRHSVGRGPLEIRGIGHGARAHGREAGGRDERSAARTTKSDKINLTLPETARDRVILGLSFPVSGVP